MHTCTRKIPAPKELFVRTITSGTWKRVWRELSRCEYHFIAAAVLQADEMPLTYVAAYIHSAVQQAELPKLIIGSGMRHT
jgi:hypothetical protein